MELKDSHVPVLRVSAPLFPSLSPQQQHLIFSADFLKSLFILPGQEKVVGGHDLIHAKVGDDVILPCHLEPPFDVNSLTIEWRFQGQIIHLHHSGAKDDKTSDPKYQGRTSMFHDEFKKGNISLRLIKVTKEDEGNYTCFVPKLQSQVRKVKVTLKLGELYKIKII
uniref:Ig-like domain-containing protein n=1 Tax=Xiphophorus maculatus TaxID=8083 RepID=A0A3B5RDY3_XIPMA